ncbi:hypothetical protein [Burkholderia sp. THE68]|uniref:hypothetical protein n=1 Tax=Burkholderia sp. THE68 TaxID=758782 RepID=UPI001E58CAFB|nr:hypothetical protein [Burkholderia sp. THE68]
MIEVFLYCVGEIFTPVTGALQQTYVPPNIHAVKREERKRVILLPRNVRQENLDVQVQ